MQLAKLIFSSETTILPVCVPNKTFGLGEGQITIKISGELHPPGFGNVVELNRPALLPRVVPKVDGARGEGDRGIGKQPDQSSTFSTGDNQQNRMMSLTQKVCQQANQKE